MAKIPVEWYIIVSVVLFGLGIFGIIVRRNLLTILFCTELVLNAINVAFVGADENLNLAKGQIFSLFIIGFAAIEAAVGLGIIVSIFRYRLVESSDELTDMKE